MGNKINKAIKGLSVVPRPDFESRILLKIRDAREQQKKTKRYIGFGISTLSLCGFLPFLVYTVKDFYQSGFFSYISLLFSDGKIVMENLGQYAMSVVDSFPFLAVSMSLLFLQIFFVAIRYSLSQIDATKSLKVVFNN